MVVDAQHLCKTAALIQALNLEAAGNQQKTDDFRRKPQETADWGMAPLVSPLQHGPKA